jgi:hypothetical protein
MEIISNNDDGGGDGTSDGDGGDGTSDGGDGTSGGGDGDTCGSDGGGDGGDGDGDGIALVARSVFARSLSWRSLRSPRRRPSIGRPHSELAVAARHMTGRS